MTGSEESRGPEPLTPSQRRFLRYWSLNMSLARRGGWGWTPGFSYNDGEWRRMGELAATVPTIARITWLAASVVIYLMVVALVLGAILWTALTVLWPNPSEVPELGFFTAIGLAMVLTVGVGMPLSVAWGGAVADRVAPAEQSFEELGDAALRAKVRAQFRRVALVVAGLFILAALAWGVVLARVA